MSVCWEGGGACRLTVTARLVTPWVWGMLGHWELSSFPDLNVQQNLGTSKPFVAYGFFPQNVFGIKEPLKDNLDNILKSRGITSPTKVRLVRTVVFPVVMYGYESWNIKKAEHQRIDTFELWCWRRLLRVPWTARRSNQSILKEISPECSLEGLMLKLKLQCFGHLMQRADSFGKTLMLGNIEGGRRRG